MCIDIQLLFRLFMFAHSDTYDVSFLLRIWMCFWSHHYRNDTPGTTFCIWGITLPCVLYIGILNKRWQFGNVHLLPSRDVFSMFVMATPLVGIFTALMSDNWDIPKRRDRVFMLTEYHRFTQSLQTFGRDLDNFSFYQYFTQPTGRERIRLLTL
jgi:hypothetical protein